MKRTKKPKSARRAHDYYPTPAWTVHRLLDRLPLLAIEATTIAEPCVGDGSIVRGVESWRAANYVPAVLRRLTWITNDIRADAPADCHLDAIEFFERSRLDPAGDPNAIPFEVSITNPPYGSDGLTERIVRAMIASSRVAIVLVRLAWLTEKRAPLLRELPPAYIFTLPQRPSFTGRGTDASAYAWAVWNRDIDVSGMTIYQVLADTPPDVIKAQKAETRAALERYDAANPAPAPVEPDPRQLPMFPAASAPETPAAPDPYADLDPDAGEAWTGPAVDVRPRDLDGAAE